MSLHTFQLRQEFCDEPTSLRFLPLPSPPRELSVGHSRCLHVGDAPENQKGNDRPPCYHPLIIITALAGTNQREAVEFSYTITCLPLRGMPTSSSYIAFAERRSLGIYRSPLRAPRPSAATAREACKAPAAIQRRERENERQRERLRDPRVCHGGTRASVG